MGAEATHACTVNGHDAQHWYEEAERWKRVAADADMNGRLNERALWQTATGFEFASQAAACSPKEGTQR